MGFNSNVQKIAADRLFERRIQAEKRAERTKAEFFEKCPRASELDRGITNSGVQAARAVLKGGDVVSEMKKLRDSNLAMQAELKELLHKNGYSETALEPDYKCKKCSDTGYYETEGRTVLCTCLKQELVRAACDELNRTAPLSLSTFDSFSLEYYDRQTDPNYGVVPYQHMDKVLKFCKAYAESFTPDSGSILMKGATGLGKTHLSLAIANEVIRRGYGVVYVSAPAISQKLEKQYFSRGDSDDSLTDILTDCDLLIIDDLGTEFKTQFTVAQLYNIFNARMLRHKPVIINTNLTMRELEQSYTQRFVSRISGESTKLDFFGKDIRIRKK